MPDNVKKDDVKNVDIANTLISSTEAMEPDSMKPSPNRKKKRKFSISLGFVPVGLWFKTELESEDDVRF